MSRAETLAGGLGLLGLLGAALGWILSPASFAGGWLVATCLLALWPLGSLALLLIHALTGGRWGEILRPSLRAGLAPLPLILPAAAPLALTSGHLYPWLHPSVPLDNGGYLNLPFFLGRLAVYALVWFGLAILVARRTKPTALAPVGLMLLALTVTFAAVDLTESLEPRFNSSVYGLLALASMGLLALALAILGRIGLSRLARVKLLAPKDCADLARLLLGLVILCAYLDFMQFLIVWQSNLGSEAAWYLHRAEHGWLALAVIVACGHFLLPFALLLSGGNQRRPRLIAGVALLIAVMEALRWEWLVLPSLGRGLGWVDLAALLGLGGMAAGLFLRRLRVQVVEAVDDQA